MSDTRRQSLTNGTGAALKPDSEKSTPVRPYGTSFVRVLTNLVFLYHVEHIGDKIKGVSDSFALTFQPENEKSMTQKIWDSVSGNQNNDQKSLMDKAKVRSISSLTIFVL